MTTRILLFAFALTQVGCAFDMTELDDADLAGADEDLLLAIPIDAARVTFYSETGQWGTRLTASAPVLGPDESRRLVTTTEIEGAGLGRRISSVRLSCGSRAASLTLFVHPNRGTDFGGFGAGTDRSYLVACAANQVVDVDLHRDAPQYADRVAAAHLVNMPNPYENVPFTYVLSALWEAELATVDGAEPLGPPLVRLLSFHTFTIEQDLEVDHWGCGARYGNLRLHVTMNDDGTFRTTVDSTYVDAGFGDAWGCRTNMQARVQSRARDVAVTLSTRLPELIGGFDPEHLFFIPDWGGVQTFSLGIRERDNGRPVLAHPTERR